MGNDLPDQYQVNYFLNGLKPVLVSQTVVANPANLAAAIEQAKLVEAGVNYTMLNLMALPSTSLPSAENKTANSLSIPTTTTIPPQETSLKEDINALTQQMQQLTLNYANISAALVAQPRQPRPFRSNRQAPQNRAPPPQNKDIVCFACGKKGHISRNCNSRTNRSRPQGRPNDNYQAANLADYYENEYEYEYEEEYEEEDDYYEEEEEAEVFVQTRANPYPSNPVSKNKHPRRSESTREEALRIPYNSTTSIPIEMDTDPIPTTTIPPKPKKTRGKLRNALIEDITKLNVSTYIGNLSSGLSVG